jgi:hypothetical protein
MTAAIKQIAAAVISAAAATAGSNAVAEVVKGEQSFIDTVTGLEWLFSTTPTRAEARAPTMEETRTFMTDFGIDLNESANTVEEMGPYVALMDRIGCCDLFFASTRVSFFSVVSGDDRWGVELQAGFIGGATPFASVGFTKDLLMPGDRVPPFARVVDLGVTPPVPESATYAGLLAGLALLLAFPHVRGRMTGR